MKRPRSKNPDLTYKLKIKEQQIKDLKNRINEIKVDRSDLIFLTEKLELETNRANSLAREVFIFFSLCFILIVALAGLILIR